MTQSSTPENVASNATQQVPLPGRGIVLLGTFGSESDARALLRLSNGRTATVSVGDSVSGQRVVAIDTARIALARGSKAQWLEAPAAR